MTVELKETGPEVGEHRVGRLMKLNKICTLRTRRHEVTTDSRHILAFAEKHPGWRFSSQGTQSKMGRRHQLYLDQRRLALSNRHYRSVQPTRYRLGGKRPDEKGSHHPGVQYGCAPAPPRHPVAFFSPTEAASIARMISRKSLSKTG